MKLALSKADLFSTLVTVMERLERTVDDRVTLMNSTADLIVLLLTGGEKRSYCLHL